MDLVKQYEVLLELDDALNKLEAKIQSVIGDSQEELGKQPSRTKRLAIELMTCSSFYTSCSSITSLTQNLQSSRSNRAVSTLVQSVTYIQTVTIWPLCTSTQITLLVTVVTVIQVQRVQIQTQMSRINQLVGQQIEDTLSENNIANVDIAPTPLHEPPHIGNEVIVAAVSAGLEIPTCTTDEDCASTAAKDISGGNLFYCISGACYECRIDANCGDCQKCEEKKCVAKCAEDQICSNGVCSASETTTTTTTTTKEAMQEAATSKLTIFNHLKK